MSDIVLENVSKRCGAVRAVDRVSARADSGRFLDRARAVRSFLWPQLVALLLFQRQFMQPFMHAGIK